MPGTLDHRSSNAGRGNMWKMAVWVSLSFWIAACSSIGPGAVPRDRVDYVNAIGKSWEQQTLLNIVKMRYGHAPIFLSVTQVITGYQFQAGVSAGFMAANSTSNADVLGLGGTAGAQGQYTDRPTIVYTPLTGVDFLQKLLKPITPSAVLFVLQAGYDAGVLMPITLNSINGINNQAWLGSKTGAPDPRFARMVQLIRDLQRARAVQVKVESGKEGTETSLITFAAAKDPQVDAKRRALRSLLGLRPGLNRFQVYYGGYSGRDDQISMMTRSMLQVMEELAVGVHVPESDVAEGKAAPGAVQGQAGGTGAAAAVNIQSGNKAPQGASIAVQFNGRWFWIADTDFQSKRVFTTVMLLFSISDIGTKGSTPIVTVPASG